MARITHDNLVQGSDEWKKHRRAHRNASEAAAMLGLSPYITRNELVRMYATGDEQEFSDYVQKYVLDHGHHVEALARPIAEEYIGEGLYPSTFSLGEYSCSTDGLTMDEEIAWEHKQWSASLAEAVASGVLSDHHMPQVQQIMMVTGATQCLFTVSDGTPDNCEYICVEADEEWFQKLRAGWAQFDEDVANYQHVEPVVEVVGKVPETLPALRIEVTGQVTASNLVEFRQQAMDVIGSIKTDLSTDADFANAKATVKWLGEVEKRLESAKENALSQTASIDALFKAISDIQAESKATRLNLNKTVTLREESRKAEIIQGGKDAFSQYMAGLNTRLGNAYMPVVNADFAGACYQLKTMSSRQNAVDTELARAKIEASAIADEIQRNLDTLRELASDHKSLFPDVREIVLKDNDDLTSLVKVRIAEHKQAEADRLEAERAKIREEEEARATAKAEADAKAVRDAEAKEAAAITEAEAAYDREIATHKAELAGAELSRRAQHSSQTMMRREDVTIAALVDAEATAQSINDSLIANGIGKQVAKKVAGLLVDGKVANVIIEFITNLAKAS